MRLFAKSYHKESDERLMILIVKNDTQAFEVLYDRYAKILTNYFYKMLWKDKEKAEDFMQDFFVKIVRKPESFDPNRSFKTWMYSVANNMCKNEYRKQETRKGTKNDLDEAVYAQDINNDVFKEVYLNQFKHELHQQLDQLDELKKQTFLLRYYEDLSLKEISKIMECSEGTVKSRLFYTLKVLSSQLTEFNPKMKEAVDS